MIVVVLFGLGLLAVLVLQIVVLARGNARAELRDLERELREALSTARRESADGSRSLREEQTVLVSRLGDSLQAQLGQMAQVQNNQIDGFAQRLTQLVQTNEERFEALRVTVDQRLQLVATDQRTGREETAVTLKRFGDGLSERFVEVRATLDQQLGALQADNAKKLDEMRQTVDEKLHKTLEERLTSSFKTVSERLEQVHKGLGEMQSLAIGVGDLKRVLTNVKTRGTYGETQLGNLLEQVLTVDQFVTQFAPRRHERERVDFAVRMPGREADGDSVYLPIDAKFPLEDYQRLQDAVERADIDAIEVSARALEERIKAEARTIRDKYINPPVTTDFALLYLPTEGLFAEVLRRPGLAETMQREYKVVVVGPTTLLALLNSLQMGFRTLAIEKRSGEVWKTLGAIKTEFGRFSDILSKTRAKLDEAAKKIGEAEDRTRQMTRKLRSVEALPDAQAQALLGSEVNELGEGDG